MSNAQPSIQLFAEALLAPGRGLPAAAERRAVMAPLAAATLASLLLAVVATPRVDFEGPALDEMDRAARKDPQAAQPAPHEVEEKLAQARKVGAVGSYAAGALAPTLAAVGAALALMLAFRVAGSRPPFGATLAAVSWGLLPLALRALLLLPAVSRMRGVEAVLVDRALPSSLGALLPSAAPPRLAALAHAVDLFSLWAVVLVALGMAHAAGTSRARSLAVVAVLWVSYILVAYVALPGLIGGAH
jgi:Yip1 domain